MEAIPTRTLPGSLVPQNSSAIAWGSVALAYGANQTVVVVDPVMCAVVQTLDSHQAAITAVAWRPDQTAELLLQPCSLHLASADSSGRILVWDVAAGTLLADCVDADKRFKNCRQVAQLQWLPFQSPNTNYLLALHVPSLIVLWNADQGTALWKCEGDKLSLFALDPFDSRIAVISDNALCLASFSVAAPPALTGPRYRVASEEDSKSDDSGEGNILKIFFCMHDRNQLFLLFRRELLAMDLEINQTIVSIKPERASDRFRTVLASQWRPALYILDETSTVTYRPRVGSIGSPYDVAAITEPLRLGRNSTLTMLAVNPLCESEMAVVSSDGKLFLFKNAAADATTFNPYVVQRIGVHAYLQNLTSGTCVKMRPQPIGRPNEDNLQLLAVGTGLGTLQIFNLGSGALFKILTVSPYAIKTMDWLGRNQLIVYSCEDSAVGLRSRLHRVDIRNGRTALLREVSQNDVTLVSLRVSRYEQYFALLFKDRPPELWDARTELPIKLPGSFSTCSAVEWSLSGLSAQGHAKEEEKPADPQLFQDGGAKYVKEYCIIVVPDGYVYCYLVDGGAAKHMATISSDLTMATVTCVAWKGEILVLGDNTGTLTLWDLKNQVPKHVATGHASVKDMAFAPGRGNRLLVLFSDGVDIWDAGVIEAVCRRKEARGTKTSIIAISWVNPERPVLVYADGPVKLVDTKLQSQLSVPALTDTRVHPRLRITQSAVALHQLQCMLEDSTVSAYVGKADFSPSLDDLQRLCSTLPSEVATIMSMADATAVRCLHAARYFGDLFHTKFWTLVAKYLRPPEPVGPDSGDIVPINIERLASQSTISKASSLSAQPPSNIPGCFSAIAPPDELRLMELQRLDLYQARRLSYDQVRAVAGQQIMMGLNEQAINTLLSTSPDNPNFLSDCLRACVIAAVNTPSIAKQIMQTAAMALISGGHLRQGVELLFTAGLGQTACIHLQHDGRWAEAARLAKATLPASEYIPVLVIWAEHLVASGISTSKEEAVLLYVSCGLFRKAIDLLLAMARPMTAALLLRACLESGAVTITGDHDDARVKNAISHAFATRVHAAYAHYLQEIGLDIPSSMLRLRSPSETSIEA
eukprot:m.82901 g.82901  ORF g.82901 m.82901 type:complete len:1096 (+) comp8141_c0_seq2:154-3441(+)